MRCEVADDPVVVSKSRPEKPGNRVEDKTATTFGVTCKRDMVRTGGRLSKASTVAKGRSFKEVFLRREIERRAARVKVAPSGTIQAVPGDTALLDWSADAD
jgi:hypothetical protein